MNGLLNIHGSIFSRRLQMLNSTVFVEEPLFAHVDEAYSKLDMSDVVWIGADELSARKGHDYLTVFADLMEKRVIFTTEGKDAETFQRFADALYAHNGHPKAITQIAIDMSPAY